jgi:prevent-host-death family protein
METAGVAELKAKLSAYLERVKAGEEVIVTERGKAIARVIPFSRIEPLTDDEERAELEELIRAGLVRPARVPLGPDFLEKPRPADPNDAVLKALLQERQEGW